MKIYCLATTSVFRTSFVYLFTNLCIRLRQFVLDTICVFWTSFILNSGEQWCVCTCVRALARASLNYYVPSCT
jgi:hypothetical protein